VSVPREEALAGGDAARRSHRWSHPDASCPRIPRHLVAGVLRRRAHGELVHVGLADEDRPGGAQASDDRRVVRRTKPLRILEPLVVCTSRVQKRSLSATGMPVNGPSPCGSPLPAARAASAAAALLEAASAVTVMKGPQPGSAA
jgi:hypothetical protein